MLRAYKTELDPNNKQRTLFYKHADAARFVYNWALADRIKTYEETGKSGNVYEQKRRFNALKDEQYPWIRETAYVVIQEAFDHLERAYQSFFRRVKQGERPGFPKFKSRKRSKPVFTMRGAIHVEHNRIKLPRIGWVRVKEKGYLPTEGVKLLSANISEQAGRWFVSLQVEEPDRDVPPATGDPLGVDLGIKALATCSDGTVFENPRVLAQQERKLKRLQRELSRRQKGSRNREKTRRKIAKCHAKIANIRKHVLHEISCYATAKTKPSVVVLEDLNVRGMMQNRYLARAIGDVSFGELRRQIEYKATWNGVDVVIANRFYPSSKTCSECGNIKPLLALSERQYVCESCGAVIDRDLNAARNLAALVNN